MLTLAGRSRGRSRGRGRGRGRGRARVCGSLLAPAPWELTFGAVAEQGGCEPEAASPPIAFRGAQLRGRPRPQRGAALLPYPPNPGGPGPEAGAPGDVTARAGSAFGASGRLASRVSPAAAAAAAAAATRERNVGERVAFRRGARGACGGRAGVSCGVGDVPSSVLPMEPGERLSGCGRKAKC